MPFNPKSLKNLGKPRTKAGRKNFLLSQEAIDWLVNQPNQSAAIEELIKQKIVEDGVSVIIPTKDQITERLSQTFLENPAEFG